jgi:hypothetical protein
MILSIYISGNIAALAELKTLGGVVKLAKWAKDGSKLYRMGKSIQAFQKARMLGQNVFSLTKAYPWVMATATASNTLAFHYSNELIQEWTTGGSHEFNANPLHTMMYLGIIKYTWWAAKLGLDKLFPQFANKNIAELVKSWATSGSEIEAWLIKAYPSYFTNWSLNTVGKRALENTLKGNFLSKLATGTASFTAESLWLAGADLILNFAESIIDDEKFKGLEMEEIVNIMSLVGGLKLCGKYPTLNIH